MFLLSLILHYLQCYCCTLTDTDALNRRLLLPCRAKPHKPRQRNKPRPRSQTPTLSEAQETLQAHVRRDPCFQLCPSVKAHPQTYRKSIEIQTKMALFSTLK